MSNVKEKFSNILVRIDGSRQSVDAVDYAITLALKFNAKLTVLYVVSSPIRNDYTSDIHEDQIPETARDFVRWAKEESQPWFAEIVEKVKKPANALTVRTKGIH